MSKITELIEQCDEKVLSIRNIKNNIFNASDYKIYEYINKHKPTIDAYNLELKDEEFFNEIYKSLCYNISNNRELDINMSTKLNDYLLNCALDFKEFYKQVVSKYDTVIIEDFTLFGLIPHIKKMGKKVIFSIGCDASAWYMYESNRDALKFLEDYANKADIVLTNSKRYNLSFLKTKVCIKNFTYVNDALQTINKEKLNLLETDALGNKLDLNKPIILSFVNNGLDCGVNDIIDCFDKIPNEEGYQLVFVNFFKPFDFLPDITLSYDLKNRPLKNGVLFYETLNHDCVDFLTKTASFVVQYEYVNYFNPYIIYAGRNAKVVLASNTPANKSLIKSDFNGIITPLQNRQDLVDNMAGLMKEMQSDMNRDKFKKLGLKLFKDVKELNSIETVVYNMLLKLFKKEVE